MIKSSSSFKNIKKDKFALIVIDDRLTAFENQHIQQYITCHQQCKELIHALTIDVALQSIGRSSPKYHCIHYSSSEQEIKDWISGKRHEDLVTSIDLVRGFENDFIIGVAGSNEIISRASAQLIKLYPNYFLSMMCIQENLLSQEHQWQNIMKREHRLEVIQDISSLISKVF